MGRFDSFTKRLKSLEVGEQLEVDYRRTTVNSMSVLINKEKKTSGHDYTLVSGKYSALITRLK